MEVIMELIDKLNLMIKFLEKKGFKKKISKKTLCFQVAPSKATIFFQQQVIGIKKEAYCFSTDKELIVPAVNDFREQSLHARLAISPADPN